MDGIIQDNTYKVVDDIIYYEDKIYLVPKSKIKERILEEDNSTNIIEPTLDDQPNENMSSTSNPLNKQTLPVVVQLASDVDLIKDYLQEQSL